jgi:uncharacterized protein with HEPN domain
MSPDEHERDRASLVDMIAAARQCLSYVNGLDLPSFSGQRMRVRAVERTLEILGEAARRVSTKLA